jgi:hypothetical protein
MSRNAHGYVGRVTNPNLPSVVYVPTGAHTAGGDPQEAHSTVELRRTGDGRVALLAYSALDRLVACCGEHQPWILLQTEDLPRIHEAVPYEVIVLDADLPGELRHLPV